MTVAIPAPECLTLLPGQQQLLQLAEGAADAFGFQCRRDAADVRQILQRPQLPAAVVQAVERDVARRVQAGGRHDKCLQRSRFAGLGAAVDHHVSGRRRRVEYQRIAAHLEWFVDLTERPAPLPLRHPGASQHRGQRDRFVERRQPQPRCPRPVACQLLADGRDQLARRSGRFVILTAGVSPWPDPAPPLPAVNSFGSGIDCTTSALAVCGGS